MNCEKCGYELCDLPALKGRNIHKASRSSRCCNEMVYHVDCECHAEQMQPLPVAVIHKPKFGWRRILQNI